VDEEMAVLDNIAEVVNGGLCTGCGACCGVCPTSAIVMRVSNGLFLPQVEEDECTSCSLCLRCCPGYSLDFEKLNSEVFGRKPEDPFLGNFSGCYLAHSNDKEIRFDSSSGGTTTQLLVYALEKGLIDGALVARMKEGSPLEPEPFIARTREEIVSASKSKYCPVATDVALKKILSEEGRFAVVGLPCHIHGVRKAEAVFEGLKDKIVLHVGLFCGHTVNFKGTDCLLRKFRVEKGQVERLDYRGKGWPGSMSIRLKDGRNLGFRFNRGWKAYWNVFSPFFFAPLRCMMCPDLFNELSDVSVGDAWLPELRGRGSGESVVVVRTPSAERIVGRMSKDGVLSLRTVSPDKVKESQAFSLNFKKANLSGRLSLFRMIGKATPNINPEPRRAGFLALLGAFLPYVSLRVSCSKRLSSFLVYVPLPVFRLYFGLFKCFSILS
jgi:coenzyme F420 hydrogenase subunit beta